MKQTAIKQIGVASATLGLLFLAATAQAVLITSPTEISGTKLWLDGNDVDGDGVAEGVLEDFTPAGTATWVDKSAAGTNNATQGTANLQPTLVPIGLNSMPVVRFDGGADTAGDYLSLPNFASGFTSATGFIIFTANGNSIDPVNARNGGAWDFGSSSASNHFGGATIDEMYDDFGIGSRPQIQTSIPTGTSTPTLYTALVTGTEFIPLINAVPADVGGFPLSIAPSWSTTPTIGHTGARYNGDVAEVIIFDRLLSDGTLDPTDNEFNDVMFYLQEKWDLDLGLTATPLPVPEPSSLVLLLTGLLATAVRRNRRAHTRERIASQSS